MRKFNVPKKARKLWIDALKSGKYEQSKNSLKNENGYCCLGVYGKVVGIDDYELDDRNYPCDLPEEYKKLYPKCLLARHTERRSFTLKLAVMNDNNKSFKEIAKYIKKHTIGV